jgi:glucosamine-6-phosphate deaminase
MKMKNLIKKEDGFMLIYKAKDYADMSRKAANIISAQIIMKPDAVLGLATGSTPIGTYQQLINWYEKGDLDFSLVRTVNLDEYKSLAPDNPQSYAYFMRDHLFSKINIKEKNTYIPNGLQTDIEYECTRYNSIIKSLGQIDLQLLGIGQNGHIGFNEPDSAFEKETHCIKLTQNTIEANARFFDNEEDVPHYAYSTGIKNIMQSKQILLIASGKSKAEALYQSIYGPIAPSVPASILQLHNHVTVVADEDALSLVLEKGLL